MSAFKRFLIFGLILTVLFFTLPAFRFRLHPLVAYLIAINLSTFILYGVDKLCAMRRWQRTPESLLHLFAFAGGSPGALLGQQTFDHKISKPKFLVFYWSIVLIQTLLLYTVLYTDLLKTLF